MFARRRLLARFVMAPWLACATVACAPTPAAVFGPVEREVQRRVGVGVAWEEPAATSAAVRALLAAPLELDGAVRIALARNRRLQAQLDGLGVAASEVAAATVLPPTTVDADYKRALTGSGSEVELVAVQDVLDLVQLPQRRGIAAAELHAAQARATAATIDLAADVAIAFDDAVAAEQARALATSAFQVASAAALLVERAHAAGNTSDLALAREQEQRERARIEIGRAEQVVAERRARLGALLGLGAEDAEWTTVTTLPELPDAPPPDGDLESAALAASLEADALRADAAAADARHRVAVVRTVLPELGVGVAAARRESEGWAAGPAVRVGVPLFNQQQGPRARALAEARRARDELAATTDELRAAITAARARVAQAHAEATQLSDVVIPLRQRVLAETVKQYDAMNASAFELLLARRELVEIERQRIDAVRRYWNAVAEQTALRRGGHPRSSPTTEVAR